MMSRFLSFPILALGLSMPMMAMAKTSQRYELMGVIVDSGHGDQRRSVAMLKDTNNRRTIFARLGDEIAPGKRVLRITSKQVAIGQNLSLAENVVPSGWPAGSSNASSTSTDESVPYFGANGEASPVPPRGNIAIAPPYDPNDVPPAYDPNMPPPTYDPNQPPIYDPNQPNQRVFPNPSPYYPEDGLHNAPPDGNAGAYNNWQDPNYGQDQNGRW